MILKSKSNPIFFTDSDRELNSKKESATIFWAQILKFFGKAVLRYVILSYFQSNNLIVSYKHMRPFYIVKNSSAPDE